VGRKNWPSLSGLSVLCTRRSLTYRCGDRAVYRQAYADEERTATVNRAHRAGYLDANDHGLAVKTYYDWGSRQTSPCAARVGKRLTLQQLEYVTIALVGRVSGMHDCNRILLCDQLTSGPSSAVVIGSN
jgi:hypothetical protein